MINLLDQKPHTHSVLEDGTSVYGISVGPTILLFRLAQNVTNMPPKYLKKLKVRLRRRAKRRHQVSREQFVRLYGSKRVPN